MKNNIKTTVLALLLALALFAGLLAVQSQVLGKYEQVEVAVAKKDMEAGTDLTEFNTGEYFEIIKVRKSLVVDSSIRRLKELYGHHTRIPFKKGAMAYQENFQSESRETKDLADPIEVSVSLSSFSDGVAGTLRKGDRVHIYFIDRESGNTELFGSGPVYISESFTSAGEPAAVSDHQAVASVFSLIIERSMSESFCEAVKTKDIILTRDGD